jgi:hypothetical protein
MENVKMWLSSQMADMFDTGIQKLIPRYDQCLSSGGDYVEKQLKYVRIFVHNTFFLIACFDSVVGIATGYGLDDREVGDRVPVGSRIFSSPRRPDRLWVPPSILSNGYRGVKRPVREADHSPPTTAEVKKIWIYTSILSYAFMA